MMHIFFLAIQISWDTTERATFGQTKYLWQTQYLDSHQGSGSLPYVKILISQ